MPIVRRLYRNATDVGLDVLAVVMWSQLVS